MSQLIFKKMSDVMKEIGAIGKSQKNSQQGYNFRGIDDMLNALYPAMCKHGVFMVPACTEEKHELRDVTRSNGKPGVDKHVNVKMTYTFFAEDGSNVTLGPVPSEGLDSGDKATNKALSAALKYALIQSFCVPTEDMEEADRSSPEITKTSANTLPSTPVSLTVTPEVAASVATSSRFKRIGKPTTTTVTNVTEAGSTSNGETW